MTAPQPPTTPWRVLLMAALRATVRTLSVALGLSGLLMLWFDPGSGCLLLIAAVALALHQRTK